MTVPLPEEELLQEEQVEGDDQRRQEGGGGGQPARVDERPHHVAAAGEDAKIGRMAGALGEYWYASGDAQAGRIWIERALASGTDIPSGHRVWLMTVLGLIHLVQGNQDQAERLGSESLVLARQTAQTCS